MVALLVAAAAVARVATVAAVGRRGRAAEAAGRIRGPAVRVAVVRVEAAVGPAAARVVRAARPGTGPRTAARAARPKRAALAGPPLMAAPARRRAEAAAGVVARSETVRRRPGSARYLSLAWSCPADVAADRGRRARTPRRPCTGAREPTFGRSVASNLGARARSSSSIRFHAAPTRAALSPGVGGIRPMIDGYRLAAMGGSSLGCPSPLFLPDSKRDQGRARAAPGCAGVARGRATGHRGRGVGSVGRASGSRLGDRLARRVGSARDGRVGRARRR